MLCFHTPLLYVSALFTYTCLYLTQLSRISVSEIYIFIYFLIYSYFLGSQNLGFSPLIYESKEKKLVFHSKNPDYFSKLDSVQNKDLLPTTFTLAVPRVWPQRLILLLRVGISRYWPWYLTHTCSTKPVRF